MDWWWWCFLFSAINREARVYSTSRTLHSREEVQQFLHVALTRSTRLTVHFPHPRVSWTAQQTVRARGFVIVAFPLAHHASLFWQRYKSKLQTRSSNFAECCRAPRRNAFRSGCRWKKKLLIQTVNDYCSLDLETCPSGYFGLISEVILKCSDEAPSRLRWSEDARGGGRRPQGGADVDLRAAGGESHHQGGREMRGSAGEQSAW